MKKSAFDILVDAAVAGERCPSTHPHGPIPSAAITDLIRAGKIRSEVYAFNFRVVTILVGPAAGKSTARPKTGKPYRVNGVMVGRLRDARNRRG